MKIKLPLLRMGRLLLFLSLFFSTTAYSQKLVSGTVYDGANGEPMVGATVLLKGTTTGTTTGLDGTYSITVPGPESILVFSFIGSETQEITVGDQTKIDVRLQISAQALDELVVIGYGSVKKSDLTGSVAVVTAENLNRTPASTFDRAIQGKAAGVMVSQTSGKPLEGITIRVRGIGSINQNPDPLYVVDGVITSSITNLNPNDIESLQVLKDASASAIYGADGANGVVIITTKRGKSGRNSVSYSSYVSINRIPKKLDIMNADEYAKFYNDLLSANGQQQVAYSDGFRQFYYGNGWQKGTDWQDEIAQTGYSQNHYVNVSGGSEFNNFSISGGYYKEAGTLRNTGADRITLRANSDFNIGKYLKVGETVNVSQINFQDGGSQNVNAWQVATITSPLMKVYNPDNLGGYEGPQISYVYQDSTRVINTGTNDKTNPLGELELPDFQRHITNVQASVYAEVKPVSWLSFKILPSAEVFTGKTVNWLPSYDMGVRSNNRASLAEDTYTGVRYSLENQLTFNKSFGDHTLTATGVYQVKGMNQSSLGVTGKGFNYEQLRVLPQSSELSTPRGAIDQDRGLSALGRIIYDYKSRYLLTASIRKDGSSNFGPGNRFGVFPSFSVAWKLNEDFLQNINQINLLKVRLGWGKTGNSNLGRFKYDDYLTPTDQFSSVFGDPQKIIPGTYIFYSFANPYIKWEAAAMTNFGFDLNAFNNKIQFSAEYYVKNQTDLLLQRYVDFLFGRSADGSYPWVNVGKLQNRGFEFSLAYKKMEGAFNYSANLTLTTIKDEIKYLPMSNLISGNNITLEKHTIASLYGYVAERILTPADFDSTGTYLYAAPSSKPSPGDLKFKDLNKDGKINDLDRTIIGKSVPDAILGLGFECYYKGIDFSFFLNGMWNYEVYNQQRADLSSFNVQDLNHNKLRSYAENYYTADRPSTEYVRADMNGINSNDRVSSWWVENASFLRMKDIQMGYSIPVKLSGILHVNKARIYASAANLFVITNYTGRDPEGGIYTGQDPRDPNRSDTRFGGTDNGTYPAPRTFTFGIQVEF